MKRGVKSRLGCFFCISCLMITELTAQEQLITGEYSNSSLTDILKDIERQSKLKFYYKPDKFPEDSYTISFDNEELQAVLSRLLDPIGYLGMSYRGYAIVVGPKDFFLKDFDANYYESLKRMRDNALVSEGKETFQVGSLSAMDSTGVADLEIMVLDSLEKGPLPQANLVMPDGQTVLTNEVGRARLRLQLGPQQLLLRAAGYDDRVIDLDVLSDGELRVKLIQKATTLNEVVISSSSEQLLNSPLIGVTEISPRQVEKLPAFLGEADLIKGLQFVPGVTSVGEGAPGYNVRGGNVDHNLVTLEEAFIFNSSHVFGFFGSFNNDLIGSSTLYKGYTPPEYHGRLASVLNINLREGDPDTFKASGSIGVVSTKALIEGPLGSEKTTFIAGGRLSYSDYILNFFNDPQIRESSASFYDFNTKVTHSFTQDTRVSFSYYRSNDEVVFADQFGFDYRTNALQGKFVSPLFSALTHESSIVYGTYDASLSDPFPNSASVVRNGIDYWKLKESISWQINPFVTLNGGASFVRYISFPGSIRPDSESSTVRQDELDEERANEWAGFMNAEIQVSERFSFSAGMRLTGFVNRGPGTFFEYGDNDRPSLQEVVDTVQVNEGERIASYRNLEPRVSAKYNLSATLSLKAGYSRVYQYLFQISNTDAITPVDQWKLSDRFLEPQSSHNYSLGLFSVFKGGYESALEVFYRDIDQLVDYRDFADLIVNDHLETEVLSGVGRAYGLEWSLSKALGNLTGTVGYTFSRAQRRIRNLPSTEAINNGDWYSSNFDKPHSLALATTLAVNQRQSISLNFVYSTGRPTTAPEGFFDVDNILTVPLFSERNGARIPDYHRLDLAYTIRPNYRKGRKLRSTWTFSLYNVYGRRNAYSLFFTQTPLSDPRVQKLSVLGSAFPAITYNFKINGE